jgi:hypothetical protein
LEPLNSSKDEETGVEEAVERLVRSLFIFDLFGLTVLLLEG